VHLVFRNFPRTEPPGISISIVNHSLRLSLRIRLYDDDVVWIMRQISRGEELHTREMNDAVTATTQQITSIPHTRIRIHVHTHARTYKWRTLHDAVGLGLFITSPSEKISACNSSLTACRSTSFFRKIRRTKIDRTTYCAYRVLSLRLHSSALVYQSKIAY